MSAGGRRPMRADRTALTIRGVRPVRMGALSSAVFLASIALAGCPPEGGTGDGGSSQNDGGVGPSSPGDDGAAPVLPDGNITADSGTTDAGGTTDDAAATVDAGPGHEICSQSWSVVTDDPNDPYNFPQVGARMMALDGSGNMVVATSFRGTVTVAGQTFQSSGTGDSSLLVVKLDSTCKVLWAKAFGAAQAAVQADGVAVDATGNIVVGATHTGPPVDFGSGPVGSVTDGRPEAVVFKLGPDGTGLWSHGYLASPGSFLIPGYEIGVLDVAVDSRGNTVFATSKGCPPRAACNPGTVDYGGGPVSFDWSLVELDANGKFVFAADASFAGQSVYFAPYSLATGSAGRVWEAGFGDEFDIVAFDASGHQQGVQKVTGTRLRAVGDAHRSRRRRERRRPRGVVRRRRGSSRMAARSKTPCSTSSLAAPRRGRRPSRSPRWSRARRGRHGRAAVSRSISRGAPSLLPRSPGARISVPPGV